MAFQGYGAPPEWYPIAAAAEAWGALPWILEAEAPALWVDRFVAVKNAEAQAAKPKRKLGGNSGGKVTELV